MLFGRTTAHSRAIELKGKCGLGVECRPTVVLLERWRVASKEKAIYAVFAGTVISGRFLFLARNADRRPRYCFKAREADVFLAGRADTVGAVLNSLYGRFNGTKQFGVSLKQSEVYVYFIVVARLIHKIPVPCILHIFPVGFLACRMNDGVALLFEGGLELLEIPFVHNILNQKVEL